MNRWRMASLSVVSNLFDLSDMMHVAATGLISPLGTKCLGQVKRKEKSLLGEDIGSQSSRARERPQGGKCLTFSGQILTNHLPGCLGAAEVASGQRGPSLVGKGWERVIKEVIVRNHCCECRSPGHAERWESRFRVVRAGLTEEGPFEHGTSNGARSSLPMVTGEFEALRPPQSWRQSLSEAMLRHF